LRTSASPAISRPHIPSRRPDEDTDTEDEPLRHVPQPRPAANQDADDYTLTLPRS
jgi:hypothetical protein